MEFPDLGKHCMHTKCNKLDFLPIKCDACNQLFCEEHYNYTTHDCPNAYKKNNQVPVCPLCSTPVPVPRGQQPDYAVGVHIDNDCQADPAKDRRKVFTNRCSRKGCKTKEVIPVVCSECTQNYCLKHRHPTDHNCEGPVAAARKRMAEAAMKRQNNRQPQQPFANPVRNLTSDIQGTMSEDEALARALALSMQDTPVMANPRSQEDLDFALARQLQAEQQTVGGSRTANRDRCNVS